MDEDKCNLLLCSIWWRNEKKIYLCKMNIKNWQQVERYKWETKMREKLFGPRIFSDWSDHHYAERVPAFMPERTIESRILRKASCRERLGESWNNEGVRAEMRTRRNCDAVQLKRDLDAERSVHFLLGVNWKCSYLSCAMECAREIRKGEGNDPSWQFAKPYFVRLDKKRRDHILLYASNDTRNLL